jgi:hypothetical protein
MVNWKRVQRPKELGGLSILDLNKFNQALRVRWRWFDWKDPNKPWALMRIALNRIEETLFRACTSITLGNGESTKFWHDRWINGQSPKDLAPSLYRLTRRKNISVAKGCTGRQWLTGLHQISSSDEVNQLVSLRSLINQVHLTEQQDSIQWNLKADGQYSTKSAYEAQFTGAFPDFEWKQMWHAKVESKCKFHSWLLLQNKLWAADRLSKYRRDADIICQLCRTQPESVLHMITQCSYSRSVWMALASWMGTDLKDPPATNYRRFQSWWRTMISSGTQGTDEVHSRLQKLICTVWNLWKERCRRVFDNRAVEPAVLATNAIQSDVQQWRLAWNRATGSLGTSLHEDVT